MVHKYTKLSDLWTRYRRAIGNEPYSPDEVQAWGLAFAGEWKARKDDICKDFDIAPEDFEYQKRYEVMKKVEQLNVMR